MVPVIQLAARGKYDPCVRQLAFIGLSQVGFQKLESILNALFMAAFVAVGGVYSGADKAVAAVVASPQTRLGIGTVVGIYINCKVDVCLPGGVYQAGNHVVVIWTAGILGADGYLSFFAAQAFAHAAHIHRDYFRDIIRNRC